MVEGTDSVVINEPVMPSIRRVNDRWRDGGLEAHIKLCIKVSAVLPSSPYAHSISPLRLNTLDLEERKADRNGIPADYEF